MRQVKNNLNTTALRGQSPTTQKELDMTTLEKIRVLEAKRDSSRANKAAGAQAESVAKDTQKIINMLRASL